MADPVLRRASPGDRVGIRTVLEASFVADALPGSTRAWIDRTVEDIEADPAGTAIALQDGEVAGLATPRHDELLVDPRRRRQGIGRALFGEAMTIAGERRLPFLQLYVAEHLPASVAFARAMGLRYHSSLWLFRLPPTVEVPAPRFPAGFVARSLGPDEDLERYAELVNTSFADHPTPISFPIEVIRHQHASPTFDPASVRLVALAEDPGRLVAFARVRVAPGDDGTPEGSINAIGVLPAFRGRGLGRELLRWGVAYARGRGAVRVELAVEALNERALELYRRHGFEPDVEWPHWIREIDRGPRDQPGGSGAGSGGSRRSAAE